MEPLCARYTDIQVGGVMLSDTDNMVLKYVHVELAPGSR